MIRSNHLRRMTPRWAAVVPKKYSFCALSALAMAFLKSSRSQLATLPSTVAVDGSGACYYAGYKIYDGRTEDVKLLVFLDPFSVDEGLVDEQVRGFQLSRRSVHRISVSGAPHRRNRLLVIRLRSDSSGGRHGQGTAGVQDSDWTTTGARRVPKTRSQRSGTSQAERQRERIGKGFRTVGPDSPFRAERGKEPGHAAEVARGQLSRHGLGVRQRSDASRATDGYGAGQL